MKKVKFLIIFIFGSFNLCFGAEESITITTYYPSPYGVYNELRVKRLAIGDNYIKSGDYDWESSDGDGGEIDYQTDLLVEGNVGIGTATPNNKIQVVDFINFDKLTSGTFLGYKAGGTINNGSANTALGYMALRDNTTGSINTALGHMALSANTTGTGNTALGFLALSANTTGINNIALGCQALQDSKIGDDNIALGRQTLQSNTTGDHNIALGYMSGGSISTGNYNIALGYMSGGSIATGSSNIIIGNSINAQSGTGSNQLSIGNLIFATGGFGTGTTVGTGNVGIGTSSPSYKLHVAGNGYASGSFISGSDLRWKENIVTLNHSLEKLLHLRGVEFNWKLKEFKDNNFPTGRQIGIIAQEMEKEFPELVMTDKEGYKSIAYDKFTAVLLEAIKTQEVRIEALQARLDVLKNRLDNL